MSDVDDKYPVSFCAKLLVQEQDSVHEISLEARKYSNIEGLSISIDGKELIGITEKDAYALYSLLKQYIRGQYEHTEAY